MSTPEAIRTALEDVIDVYGVGNIVSQNRVEKIGVDGDTVMLSLNLPVDDAGVKARVESESREAIKKLGGIREVIVMTKGAKPKLGAASGRSARADTRRRVRRAGRARSSRRRRLRASSASSRCRRPRAGWGSRPFA